MPALLRLDDRPTIIAHAEHAGAESRDTRPPSPRARTTTHRLGAPPPSIVSPDGNVYLHWEFHRNPLFACSTYFARPYIIKVPQKTAPPRVDPPAGPFGPEEEPPPAKQGSSTHPTPYAAR